MALSYDKKIKILSSLNWDYTTFPEDMLAVVEGRLGKARPFDQDFLFVRFPERRKLDHRFLGHRTGKGIVHPESGGTYMATGKEMAF
jgi:hypothetical protein